jgi:23S rRNA U2552 (ribose-2'-O)-methylase RlmE/FtsJ
MADPKSEYADFETQFKASTIRHDIIKEKDWQPDKVIHDAITKYTQLQETAALRALQTTERLIDKINNVINDVEEKDLENEKVMDKVLGNAKKLNDLSLALPKLKQIILKEQAASVKIRGGGEKGDFEE